MPRSSKFEVSVPFPDCGEAKANCEPKATSNYPRGAMANVKRDVDLGEAADRNTMELLLLEMMAMMMFVLEVVEASKTLVLVLMWRASAWRSTLRETVA